MDIVQFIIFAIIFFRIISFFNKMAGGNKKKKTTPNVWDEFQKQLKQLEENFEPIEAPVETTQPRPISKPNLKEIPQYEGYEYAEPVSLEITEAPYSNLEEGIIDEVHASKFEHHDITKDEVGKEVKKKGKNYLKDFDAKKAFIHSVIFERKHFDV